MAAAMKRKRILFRRMGSEKNSGDSCKASVAEKGHFVVYSMDMTRFMIPLSYLSKEVVRELFTMAEEEFGISREGPIVLPVDTLTMEYIISLIKGGLGIDQEKALLLSFTGCGYSGVDKAEACRQIYVRS